MLNISRLTFLVTDLPPPEGSASLYDLDTGALSDALRQAFSDAGIGLSAGATVEVKTAGEEWFVRDGGTEYLLRRKGTNPDGNYSLAVLAGTASSLDGLNLGVIKIEAGCTLYFQATSPQALRGDVDLALTTDGQFLISGKLVFADGKFTATAKMFADLRDIASGSGQLYFLMDVPDEPRVLTVVGTLTFGFIDPDGNPLTRTSNVSGEEMTCDEDQIQVVRTVGTGASAYTCTATIIGSKRSEGDALIVNGLAGNDTISGAGDLAEQTGVWLNLAAMTFVGGVDNDTLVGTPFADVLNSGTGDDTVTGGFGVDTFLDAGGSDTLVEILDCDMSLFSNYFVCGTVRADNGTDPFHKGIYIEEQNAAPADPLFPAPYVQTLVDRGDVYASGSEIESLLNGSTPIFEHAVLSGGTGNNLMVVNDRDGQITVGGTAYTVTSWHGDVTFDNRSNGGVGSTNGDEYNEYYLVNLTGTSGAKVYITDTGGADGYDEIYVFTTNGPDMVTLLATRVGTESIGTIIVGDRYGTGTVPKMTLNEQGEEVPVYYQHDGYGNKVQRTDAEGRPLYDMTDEDNPQPIWLETTTNTGDPVMVPPANPNRDDVVVQGLERVTVSLLGGDDSVRMEDTAATTILNLGTGDDTIVVAVVPQINDPGNTTFEYPRGIPVADTENMTNGNSHSATVYGGDGDDEFEVNHNAAKLYLSGDAGDDTFVIYTFLVLQSDPGGDIDNLTTLFGGSGSNRYQYLQNAPVYISGGSGTDTVVIVGTAIRDVFIVTDKYVAGAGRIVYFTGIERLEINAGSGHDAIYLLSSPPDLEITVRGGSGDDEIHLGGDPPTLLFDPPAFEYQPPAYQVQDPPVETWKDFTLDLPAQTVTVDHHVGYDTCFATIRSYLNTLITLLGIFLPDLRLKALEDNDLDTIVEDSIASYWHGYGKWWIFSPETYINLNAISLKLEYRGTVLPEPRTVVPATVTLDPPPFAFKADAVLTVGGIRGRVTIDGGDDGDTLTIHEEGAGSGRTGSLTSTTIPVLDGEVFQIYELGGADIYVSLDATFTSDYEVRQFSDGSTGTLTKTIYNQTYAQGQGATPQTEVRLIPQLDDQNNPVLDVTGNPVLVEGDAPVFETLYTQRVENDLPQSRTFYSVTGLGMGSGTSLDGTHYNGVEYENIEGMTVLLGDGSDTFTFAQTSTASVTLSLGGGADTVYVKDLDAPATIKGAAGGDSVYVRNDANTLADILQNLTVQGNAYLDESVTNVQYDSSNDLHNRVLAGTTQVYVNTYADPDLYGEEEAPYAVYRYTDATGHTTYYTRQDLEPIVFRAGPADSELWVYSVVLDPDTAQIEEDLIQERSDTGVPVWRDTNGEKVQWDPDAEGAWDEFPVSLLDWSDSYLFSLKEAVDDLTDLFGFAVLHTLEAAVKARILESIAPSLIIVNRVAAGPLTTSSIASGAATDTATDTLMVDNTGGGADCVNVRAISSAATVNTEGGNDRINVGSNASGTAATPGVNTNGNADNIAGTLTVNGGAGIDVLDVDDTTDTSGDTGTLTSTTLSGIFGTGGSITYGTLETLNIRLGSGGNTFYLKSSHAGQTNLETGSGADAVHVGSQGTSAHPVAGSLLDAIGGPVSLDAQGGTNDLYVDDRGDTDSESGTLTATRIAGLGMTGHLDYTAFATLSIWLGAGNDHFYVESTHSGSTTIDTGDETTDGVPLSSEDLMKSTGTMPFNDVVTVNSIAGVTTISLGGGDDLVRVNYYNTGAQTFASGVQALLNLYGNGGSDLYMIALAGGANAEINVQENKSADDPGIDRLQIFGTNLADYFLFRPNAVSAIELDEDRQPKAGGGVERVNYESDIGELSVYGREGDDIFVLDDNDVITTVYGDEGNDTFQVGQLFQSPRGTNAGLAQRDQFDTILTTQGYLSNGISYATTLYGGAGNDSFTVYHNLANLFLYGEQDNDTFVVRAFVRVDPDDPKAPFTNINGGQGADFITYTVNAPVNVEGGDGFDTLTVVGTEFGDDFVVAASGIYGAGLYIVYGGIEQVVVDALEGNDRFYIDSTR